MSICPHRTSRHRRLIALAVITTVALVGAACSRSTASNVATTTKPKLTGSITVSAASSLTATFTQLGTQFQSAHPGTTVSFNFASSGALATQITQGSPADVFASASPSNMATVQQAGDILGKPVTFVSNSLEIVVKPENPLGIHSLADLTKANVVAICVSTAPCGLTADQALKSAGVTIPTSKITLGENVDATFEAVTTGDADAAIVYVTNAKTVGDHGVGIPIPASLNVTTSYPIAVVKSTKNRTLSLAWIAYVLGSIGQKELRAAGFLPPR